MKKCINCLYDGQAKNGRPACVKFQKYLENEQLVCPWWISQDDPECSICHRPTEGKAVIYAGEVYCQDCARRLP